MPEPGEITEWLSGLRAGNDAAAQRLWEAYFRRLVGLARTRLAGRPAGPAGSEDVALSAFDSFCRRAEAGRFPQLADRTDLWQVLVMLTARKAIDAVRRERAGKRGGGAVEDGPSFADVIGDEPSPAFAAEIAEAFQALLDRLQDDDLKQIAVWKLEGYTDREIAKLDRGAVHRRAEAGLIRSGPVVGDQ